MVKPGDKLTIEEAMELAICEAKKGFGLVDPNPPVGCVILDADNGFLDSGFHKRFGDDHAEIDAIKKLSKDQLKAAKLIVTLEPCSFVGKTPSCAKTLAQTEIAEVIYGALDPNPKVHGAGIEILNEGNIKTTHLKAFESECHELIEVFSKNQNHQSCFVALKSATSLDGQMALQTGESQWITCEESRSRAQLFRAKYQAVLIGSNTYLNDNPRLNIRSDDYQLENKVVILNSDGVCLNTIEKSKLAQCRDFKNIYVCVDAQKSNELRKKTKVNVIPVNATSEGLDLEDCLVKLYQAGIYSVLVEGGPKVLSQFVKHKHFDKWIQFIAPSLLGGRNSVGITADFGIEKLKQKIELEFYVVEKINTDLLILAKPKV